MAPSTWRRRPRRRARGKGAGGAAKRSTRAPSSAGQGAVRAVVVDKLVKASEKAHAPATSGAPLLVRHSGEREPSCRRTWSRQADGGLELQRLSHSLLSVGRSHTDLNPAC